MPVAGELIRASDVTRLEAVKTATESVTSSTTLQNDDELLLSVLANTTYFVFGLLFYDGATAGDFKFSWTGPSGYAFDFSAPILGTGTTSAVVDGGATNTLNMTAFTEADTVGAGAAGAGTTIAITITGVLIVGGTAGTFQLQWAQFGSSATATRVFAPSCLLAIPRST